MNKTQERKKRKGGVFMLGMHRSGTSLITGILAHLGFNLGKNLLDATVDNAKGYFERLDIVMLNDNLMRFQNTSFHTGISKYSNIEALNYARNNNSNI